MTVAYNELWLWHVQMSGWKQTSKVTRTWVNMSHFTWLSSSLHFSFCNQAETSQTLRDAFHQPYFLSIFLQETRFGRLKDLPGRWLLLYAFAVTHFLEKKKALKFRLDRPWETKKTLANPKSKMPNRSHFVTCGLTPSNNIIHQSISISVPWPRDIVGI